MLLIDAFANETQAFTIGELNVENRLDRVSFYGSVAITRDKAGLAFAKSLKETFDSIVLTLESEELPDQIEIVSPGQVDNPFGLPGPD
jgi:hypothetical protein